MLLRVLLEHFARFGFKGIDSLFQAGPPLYQSFIHAWRTRFDYAGSLQDGKHPFLEPFQTQLVTDFNGIDD